MLWYLLHRLLLSNSSGPRRSVPENLANEAAKLAEPREEASFADSRKQLELAQLREKIAKIEAKLEVCKKYFPEKTVMDGKATRYDTWYT